MNVKIVGRLIVNLGGVIMNFKESLGKKRIFFDGAMGTMLQAAGLKPGELPELWNLTHPEIVQGIHAAYVKAGAQIIKTDTFGANALKLAAAGANQEQVITQAVQNARRAGAPWVALDIGPTGKLLSPYGDLPFAKAVEVFAQMVKIGTAAGADLILIETMSDTYEAKAAILAAKENSSLPVICTFSFDASGHLLNGADVPTALIMAEALGVDAVGFNCGVGPDQLLKLLPAAKACTSLPLAVNPNAGLPCQKEGQTYFAVGPEEFAVKMKLLAEEGAALVGGCCGTTPDHIAALVQNVKDLAFHPGMTQERLTAVTGYGSAVYLGERPVVIGERINPTGKKLLKEALKNEDLDYLCRLGLEQLERRAQILDVNVGTPGIVEADLLPKAIKALQSVSAAPLQIDTADYHAMEAGLRLYNGRPLLNSVNGKEESLNAVLPLAKKYGAVLVGLCLDDNGIPADAAGRIAIAEKIIKRAGLYGISSRDLLIDPLAMTISTGGENAKIDLEIIRTLTQRGIKTIMGISNISFGLPARDYINSTFLSAALAAGLSCAILNPKSDPMMGAYDAACALQGHDQGCKDYVAHYAAVLSGSTTAAVTEPTLYDAVVKGLSEQSRQEAEKLVTAGEKPLTIIDKYLVPALDFVGDGFEQKKLFLPQLLMSADAAKAAFEVLRTVLGDQNGSGDIIVLATVKGDIHDIGKNIVKALLGNYGYRIVDLGKDVPVEEIIRAVTKHEAKLAGLSALMTTTVESMEAAIKALHQFCPNCRIMVGGAVLTKDYAASIGADDYEADAISAVRYARRIFGGQKN